MLVSEAVMRALAGRLKAAAQQPTALPGKSGVHVLYAVTGVAP
jgi:hypothetical protein